MGFFSELFRPKAADSSNAREAPINARAGIQSGDTDPALTPEGTKQGPAVGPVSAESRKKTSRISLSLPDREIKLVLGDVIHRIPSHFLKPGPHDLQCPLHFSIQDLFSDIARGRAAVPLSKIAKLCPQVFRDQIDLVEDIQVQLPLQKLVGQVGAFPNAGAPFPTQKPPENKPPTGAAAVKSDAVAAPFSGSAEPEKTSIAEAPTKPPAFTDENISLRLTAIIPTVPKEAKIGELEAIDDSVRITLPYRLIEPQLAGGKVEVLPNDFIDALPTDYRIYFARGATVTIPIPLEEILAAQSRGNVPNTGEAAKPGPAAATAEIKTETPSAELEKPALLPVDLPAPATPSSPANVSEPAASAFGRPLTIPPPRILAQPQTSNQSQPILISESASSPPSFASLQPIFQTDEPLDAWKIAQLICRFPGIAACILIAKNNLIQAGVVPSDFDIETFRRTASENPQSFAGDGNKPEIGPAQNPVFDSERFMASFFTQPEACLCVFQNERHLPPEVRDKLTRILDEIARVL